MKYALANMLNGAGGLNADQLALDLQFAADKTLTARKGPTPTFTRASSGTFVGSNGLIQSAGNNVARFDHDPVTLASRGLLIEESRTNLVFPSETLTTQTLTVTAVAHTLSFYGSGTVVLSGAHSATVVGTGDYPSRRTFTFTPTAGSLTLTVTGTVQYANLEAGSFATSYIPTTTSSVVRSADVCSISGTNFTGMYNPLGGSLLGSAIFYSSGATRVIADVNDGTINNRLRFFRGSAGAAGLINTSNNITDANIVGSTLASDVLHKMATGFAVNDFAFTVNGTLAGIDASAALVISPTTLTIGDSSAGAGRLPLNGTVVAIRYYRKRLDNSKLASLTV